MLEKNQIIELEITDFDYDGFGISHFDNHTIFVSDALIGEKHLVKLLKVNKTIAFAKSEKIIIKSPNRVEPKCPYYKLCGGCNLMHLNYEEQLKVKVNALKNTLTKMIGEVKLEEVIKADRIWNYRNKISLPVGNYNNGLVTGFYQKRSHNIISANSCLIEQEGSRIIVQKILKILEENNFSSYDELAFKGDIRHLVLRANTRSEFMLIVVANSNVECLINVLKQVKIDNLVSIFINVNKMHNNVILSDEYIHVNGSNYLEEVLFENVYQIHPNSFLQVNYQMMKKLYSKAIEVGNFNKDEIVLDAYCGIGTIGLSLANKVKEIIGVEIVPEAIKNAKENAKRNKIDNATFYLGAAEELISDILKEKKIDTIILDPPRKGTTESFINAVANNKIEKVIYISCGPKSLARDLKMFLNLGYEIKSITPVDLFPHTSHIETIIGLYLK